MAYFSAANNDDFHILHKMILLLVRNAGIQNLISLFRYNMAGIAVQQQGTVPAQNAQYLFLLKFAFSCQIRVLHLYYKLKQSSFWCLN